MRIKTRGDYMKSKFFFSVLSVVVAGICLTSCANSGSSTPDEEYRKQIAGSFSTAAKQAALSLQNVFVRTNAAMISKQAKTPT